MAELKIWCLDLSKYTSPPDGVLINGTNQQEADRVWAKYGSEAEEMKEGLHDLTPPTLKSAISSSLFVLGNFHGIHKIDHSSGRIRLLKEPTLKYMNSEDGISVVRLPEDTYEQNVTFMVGNTPARLYYMLRWLQSPTQSIDRFRGELVGAGIGGIEPQGLTQGTTGIPRRPRGFVFN